MDCGHNERLKEEQMSDAITNKIKTEFSTYLVKKTDYDSATESAKATLKPYRLSDNTVVGTAEEIESSVKLPETRIQSVPETGSESSSGNLEGEWNIDEQDDLLASVMCSEWEEGESTTKTSYEVAETQPIESTFSEDEYYVVSKGTYTKAESFTDGTTYYVAVKETTYSEAETQPTADNFTDGTYYTNIDGTYELASEFAGNTTYYVASETATGEYKEAETQPTSDNFSEGEYYTLEGKGEYVKASSYDPSATYYVQKTVVASSVKKLSLGTKRDIYYMLKKYNQDPKAYEWYTGIQVDQLQITMALNAFVTLSWALLGANNPAPVLEDPTVNAEYADALTTKSFITRELTMNIKDYTAGTTADWTFEKSEQMRQCPSFELTISNNKERTDALGEKEAIEMSDGDFVVEGTFECWNADEKAINIKADAINGKDKQIEVSVYRTVAGVTTTYSIRLIAHLKTPSESKDGNKLKYSVPFSVNTKGGIQIVKTVVSE